MSDTKLRELEMEWKAQAGNFAHEGPVAVAYLAELLRAGELRHADCVLAWRQHRVEVLLSGKGVHAWQAPADPKGARFDPEIPVMANAVLLFFYADDPSLVTEHLSMPRPSCHPEAHLGPIDYEGGDPVCTRCGTVLAVFSDGERTVLRDAIPQQEDPVSPEALDAVLDRASERTRCLDCGCGVVAGLQRHYKGCPRG